jgi:hypothetical protein
MNIPDIAEVKGVGISSMIARLVKNNNKVAMYLRDDDVYEVGLIKFRKEDVEFPSGHKYKKGEFVYWGNEDFGKVAKTTKSREHADQLFEMFTKLSQNKE